MSYWRMMTKEERSKEMKRRMQVARKKKEKNKANTMNPAFTEGMLPVEEEHLQKIKDDFLCLVDRKYRKGSKEHGGVLPEKGILELLGNAIDEAIDQVVYLLTLQYKLNRCL